MSDHGIEAQRRNRPLLIQLAKEFELGLVATNDVHFLERSHHEAHDVMICIGTGTMVADEKRMHYVPELYFKSGDEMAALFADCPEAISNTVKIAERCNLTIEFNQSKYPDTCLRKAKHEKNFFVSFAKKVYNDVTGSCSE